MCAPFRAPLSCFVFLPTSGWWETPFCSRQPKLTGSTLGPARTTSPQQSRMVSCTRPVAVYLENSMQQAATVWEKLVHGGYSDFSSFPVNILHTLIPPHHLHADSAFQIQAAGLIPPPPPVSLLAAPVPWPSLPCRHRASRRYERNVPAKAIWVRETCKTEQFRDITFELLVGGIIWRPMTLILLLLPSCPCWSPCSLSLSLSLSFSLACPTYLSTYLSENIFYILLRPWWQRGEQGRSGFARGGQGHGAPSAASSTNNRKRGGSGLPLPSLSLSPPFPEGERAADVKAVRGVLILRTFPFLIPI